MPDGRVRAAGPFCIPIHALVSNAENDTLSEGKSNHAKNTNTPHLDHAKMLARSYHEQGVSKASTPLMISPSERTWRRPKLYLQAALQAAPLLRGQASKVWPVFATSPFEREREMFSFSTLPSIRSRFFLVPTTANLIIRNYVHM